MNAQETNTIKDNKFAILASVAMIVFMCLYCKSCSDNQDCIEERAVIEGRLGELQDSLASVSGRVQENRDSIFVLQDSLANVSERVQENRDSILVLQDSLKNIKSCQCKKGSAKKPVKKPTPVVTKPEPAPVIVKHDTVYLERKEPVDTVSTKKAQIVFNNNSDNNVVNINNGTINNYYGPVKDTTKHCSCTIIIERTHVYRKTR